MKPQTKNKNANFVTPLQFHEEKNNVNTYFASESSGWNDIYQKEDVYSIIHQDRRAIAFQYFQELSLPRDARILEIGCGAGLTSVDIARQGYVVQAVDSVEAMIDLTRKNALKFGMEKQIHASVMDVYNLQFSKQTFALVIALGVAPWLADLNRALKEISRVLTPGGYVLMNVDNRYRLNHLLDPFYFPRLAGLKERLRDFLEKASVCKTSSIPRPKRHSIKEFESLLESASLVKLKHRMLGFGPFTFLKIRLFPNSVGIKLHRYLQNEADKGTPLLRSTGSQYLVLAHKM